MMLRHDRITWLINSSIILIAALFFIPFLGGVHLFDWDEINFAESAREMIESGDYLTVQINFIPFWEKPPLFIWMQVLSMKVFGINEFAARFPNAICGIVSLLVLFNIGRKLIGRAVRTYCGCFSMADPYCLFSILNPESLIPGLTFSFFLGIYLNFIYISAGPTDN